MAGKHWIALCFCAALAGCGTTNPIVDQVKVANPFGFLFRDRDEVLARIPVGTPVHQAEVIMREYGFDLWCRQRHASGSDLVFHASELVRLRAPSGDVWVTLHVQQGKVVDAEVHTGST